MGHSDLPPELLVPDNELDALAKGTGENPVEPPIGRDILLVDDNMTNLVAIEAALGPLGRNLVLARSGTEALARLLEQDFALILLDVAMPDMDGFETAHLIRARARNHATPIIFITGMSWQDADVIRGYELGAFDFLMKPVRAEVLRAKAKLFVDLQDRTRELHEKGEELRQAQQQNHERELVAQRRRYEAMAMERQMEQMALADRRKDEFLAILAHELRNPLQPLQTALEVIEHDPDRPVAPRIRGIIQRQVHHITRLVDDLLDVARFTAGKLDLRREQTQIAPLVAEAITATSNLIDAQKHALEVIDDGTNPAVFGDSVRIVQMLVNLLTNSAKYTPAGGKITVRFGTRENQDGEGSAEAFVRVSDNGRGISSTLLATIFDMFVQERTSPDGAGGLGLGLGLVRRLVELHGGYATAESEGKDKGAAFTIAIPLALATARTGKGTMKQPALLGIEPEGLRAIVVDDAPDLRELLADLLRLRGHTVTTAGSGREGVKLILDERPDVALIDIGLPDMDGYAVARAIRESLPGEAAQAVRLVAVTGYGQDRDRAKALAAGFDAHVVKPVNADGLLRAITGPREG